MCPLKKIRKDKSTHSYAFYSFQLIFILFDMKMCGNLLKALENLIDQMLTLVQMLEKLFS